jgi:hypothetical protein
MIHHQRPLALEFAVDKPDSESRELKKAALVE